MEGLTRRQAVTGGAALAFVSAASVEAKAHDPLVDLEREWHKTNDRAHELQEQADEMKGGEPQFGPILNWTGAQGRTMGIQLPENIDAIEKDLRRAARYGNADKGVHQAISRFVAKLRDDLEALCEAREAEWERRGILALEREAEALWERADKLEMQILETPATTPEGVAVKLRMSASHLGFCEEDWGGRLWVAAQEDLKRLSA